MIQRNSLPRGNELLNRLATIPLAETKTPLRAEPAHESFAAYGTCQTAHPRAGRGQRKNAARVRFSGDRPSRPGIQGSLRKNPTSAPAIARYEATGLSEHLLSLGCDGRSDSEPGFEKSPQLHVRRVLGQMARCLSALRQTRRAAPGTVGFAHPPRGRGQTTRQRTV